MTAHETVFRGMRYWHAANRPLPGHRIPRRQIATILLMQRHLGFSDMRGLFMRIEGVRSIRHLSRWGADMVIWGLSEVCGPIPPLMYRERAGRRT